MSFKLEEFNYHLPPELIAQAPAKPRDAARLMIVDRIKKSINHERFSSLGNYLRRGDVLVLNDSKVFPARLLGKKETGGAVEVFLHHPTADKEWECLVGGRVCPQLIIHFPRGLEAKLLKNNNDGTWQVKFNYSGEKFWKIIKAIGLVPLPPYIKSKESRALNQKRYQTVYAAEAKTGSVAAPTAGLHFTPRLLKKLKDQGVVIKKVTLHVGLGTFAPVKTADIRNHQMHAELAMIDSKTAAYFQEAKKQGRRLVAVGTTSARTLETWAQAGFPDSLSQWTQIFIYPGYQFQAVDALVTNFHLPQSTLLMMISALADSELIKKAYQEAVACSYQFFSFGDAMLII